MTLSQRIRNNIFLIDGLGAISTAILLSQVLASFTDFFGIGEDYLYLLATIAAAFAVYSITNHWLSHELPVWKRNLKIIAIANVIYSVITGSMLVYLSDRITLFGWLYFLGELAVVLLLVSIEWRIARQTE